MMYQQFERTLNAGAVALGLALCGLTGGIAHAQNAPGAGGATTPVYPTGLVNIAAAISGGQVIDSSSTFEDNAQYSASNLIDGQVFDPTSKTGSAGWISNKFDPIKMDYVTIGFKDNAIQKIGKIVINPASAATPERWAKDVEVQVSTDSAAGPYSPVAQISLKRVAEPQEFVILPAEARFVRLLCRSNWGSDRAVALGEVEIYAAIDQSDAMGNVIARLEGAIRDLQRFNDTQGEIQSVMGTRTAETKAKPKSGVRQVSTNPDAGKAPRLAQGVEAPAVGGGNVNIAAATNGGKVVDVSSTFNDDQAYKADNLINGESFDVAGEKGDFGWASQGFAPGRQWVTIGFKDDRTRLVSKFVINPASNQSAQRWATRIEVQVTTGSPTDGPFRTVATFNVRPEPVNQDFTMRPVEAKYVRFNFTANGPGNPSPLGDPSVSSDRAVSLGEIEIYEPTLISNDLSPLISRFRQVLVDLKRLNTENPTLNTAALGDTDLLGAPLGQPVSQVAANKTNIEAALPALPAPPKKVPAQTAAKSSTANSAQASAKTPAKSSTKASTKSGSKSTAKSRPSSRSTTSRP